MLPIPKLMALLAVRACHVTAQLAQNRPSTAQAIQPRFPENCETLPADQTGTLRSLSLYEPYFGEYDKACIVTGSPCKVNGDCPVPRRDQCRQDRLGVSDDYKECIKGYENDREIKRYCANEYPTTGWVYAIKKAECIDGFCRGRGDAGTECDCLVGCGLKTSDFRDQSCIKGKTEPAAAAASLDTTGGALVIPGDLQKAVAWTPSSAQD
ncbi:hypothetical protein LIA77_04012 [Sarocladium implicatum]|nr:hypothetical protein LIA77_04012 [Sarocladium implicatum]